MCSCEANCSATFVPSPMSISRATRPGRATGHGASTRSGGGHQDEFNRVTHTGGLLRAAGTVLVVEIVSPGSRRTDNLVKRGEYADAGIPFYWIIDADAPISLVACHLAGSFGYQDGGTVTGVFESTEPFPLRVDLDALC
jgi:hypothetical protein